MDEITYHTLGVPQVAQVVSKDELPAGSKDARFSIDEIVYEPYAPRQYGRVLAIGWSPDPRYSGRPFYRVRWKNGREGWTWELHLKSLEQLLADHEKKISTHRTNIAKGKKL